MFKALDLFAGAGGFSLGLENAGFEVIGAVEVDKYAVATHKKNFPDTPVFSSPVEDLSDSWVKQSFDGVDLLCGGPPCQGFSVAGPSQYRIVDPRNSLILEMARFVKVLLPSVVILENVSGILRGKLGCGNKAVDKYFNSLSKLGYFTKAYMLQAADFGVPQFRRRVFLVSVLGRDDFSILDKAIEEQRRPWLSALDAISDLPKLNHGEVYEASLGYDCAPQNSFQKEMRLASSQVFNHVAMRHSQRVLNRVNQIPMGGSMRDVPEEHGQRERNTLVVDGKKKRYKMNYSRLTDSSPSIAITANFQTIHVHPTQHRMLTAREGARIQTFPDSFILEGPRTLPSKKLLEREGRGHLIGLSQYNQIGNAVPPMLAKVISTAVKKSYFE